MSNGPILLKHGRAVWLMVLVNLMWSVAGVVSRQLQTAQGFEITFWRSFFTLVSMLVILPLLRGREIWGQLVRAPLALWISGFCWSVMFTAFMVALSMTSVAQVLVTTSVGPVFTALAARVLIGHPIKLRTWITMAVAGSGIVAMQFNQLGHDAWEGTLVALCVPLAGAINWTTVQHSHAKGHDIDMLPAVLIGALISAVSTLPLGWPFQATGTDLLWLSGLGLFQLAIPCCLVLVSARVLKAPELALLVLLESVFGIGLAWLFAGEAPNRFVLFGGSLVIIALAVNELLGWRLRKV